MNEMTYTEWLEKEINIYKRENKLLNEKLDNLNTMFNEVYDNELETREKKNDILKWSYTLQKENKQLKDELKEANSDVGIFIEEEKELKQRISNLVTENKKLKLELFELYRNKQ